MLVEQRGLGVVVAQFARNRRDVMSVYPEYQQCWLTAAYRSMKAPLSSRIFAVSMWPLMIAMCSADTPHWSFAHKKILMFLSGSSGMQVES